MCRSIGLGCGIVATAFVVLSVLLAARVGALARRIAPRLPEAPVSVAGECPENEVMAWVEGYEEREAKVVSHLEGDDVGAPEEGSAGGPFADIDSLDLDAWHADLERIARAEVPPCLIELRDAEVAWLGVGLRSFEVAQEGRGPIRLVHTMGVLAGMRRGWGPSKSRMTAGYAALGKRLGKDLSPYVPDPDPEAPARP